MQISHRGKYSIERMMALDEYTQTTSMLRVLLVCVASPLPMIVFVLLVELIPLQSSSDGWRANYGIWIRTFIQAGTVALAAADQARYFIAVQFFVIQRIILFFNVAVTYTAAAILAAAFVGFPIPFMAITMSVAFFPVLIISFRIVIGGRVFRKILAQHSQLFAFVGFLSAQMLLLLVYPFYQVLFGAASDNVGYQLSALLLLPLLKSAMKNLVSLTISRMEDLVPEGVIFTVDFFNAVYLATSMQNTTSAITVAIIMVIDVIQTGIALKDLYKRTDVIVERLQELTGNAVTQKNVLEAALSVCRSTASFKKQQRTFIRTKSCLPYDLSDASRTLLDQLQYFPHSSLTNDLLTPQPPALPHCPQNAFQCETLRLLFTTECLILAEYLESIMPFLYAIFVLVMVKLPNAQYHSELEGIDVSNVNIRVRSVFIYGSLELLSMVALVVILAQRGGFKVLHQLAFALETQRSLVQGKLLLWMLMVMGFRVVHFGADFTFHFAWL
ncbi:hypothetical protein V7S43_007142 [Phytophthora oleae]|uniref:Uncharacterized protein n=1 Tax=Phytophthora oleae TaxID=2107226 RepID=A0ABD3FLH0_9STRA